MFVITCNNLHPLCCYYTIGCCYYLPNARYLLVIDTMLLIAYHHFYCLIYVYLHFINHIHLLLLIFVLFVLTSNKADKSRG